MSTIMTKNGVLAVDEEGNWKAKEYTIQVEGVPHKIAGMTRSGNLLLARAEQPKSLPTNHINLTLAAPPDLNWDRLRQKMHQYMYTKKDGTPTTGRERNVLADRLSRALKVSTTVAWNWSKPDAPMPRMNNLKALASFDFEKNRL